MVDGHGEVLIPGCTDGFTLLTSSGKRGDADMT
jgi:hypothetical protein